VLAFKPGNVSIGFAGHGMQAQDFLDAATVAAPALARIDRSLGEVIHDAVRASLDVTGCNTNLGIILLAAPLAQAALLGRGGESLQERLNVVLDETTVADAAGVFAAIRAATPAGLGTSDEQDVANEPSASLRDVMRVAAVRDRIAYQYVHAYRDIFELGLPLLRSYRDRWHSIAWASVGVFLALLSRFNDTHIERKYGSDAAAAVRRHAQVLESDFKACENPATFVTRLENFDRGLKRGGVNPGTSADLTVACVLALLLEYA